MEIPGTSTKYRILNLHVSNIEKSPHNLVPEKNPKVLELGKRGFISEGLNFENQFRERLLLYASKIMRNIVV